MIHHEISMHLNCPPPEVFAFLADPQKVMLWQPDLVKSEIVTAGPLLRSRHIGNNSAPRQGSSAAEQCIVGEICQHSVPAHV